MTIKWTIIVNDIMLHLWKLICLAWQQLWLTPSCCLKLKNNRFDQLVSQCNLHAVLNEKPRLGQTRLSCRDVWKVAHRLSGGTLDGGHWRHLSIRNHDNRVLADWSWLGAGLSKNKEIGHSCSKAHKTGQHDWVMFRAMSTQTVLIEHNIDKILEKLTALQRKLDRPGYQWRILDYMHNYMQPARSNTTSNNRDLIWLPIASWKASRPKLAGKTNSSWLLNCVLILCLHPSRSPALAGGLLTFA